MLLYSIHANRELIYNIIIRLWENFQRAVFSTTFKENFLKISVSSGHKYCIYRWFHEKRSAREQLRFDFGRKFEIELFKRSWQLKKKNF